MCSLAAALFAVGHLLYTPLWWIFQSPEQRGALEKLKEGEDYECIEAQEGFLVLRRSEREP